MRRINDSKNCIVCKKLFSRIDFPEFRGSKWLKRKYCSRICYFKVLKTEEIKKKMGDGKRGIKREPHTQEWKYNMSKILGGKVRGKYKQISEEGLINLRAAAFKRRGKNHPNWIKDRTKLKKSDRNGKSSACMVWKKEIYKLDNYKCRMKNEDCCGIITAHHILNWIDYPELRYELNNGITLCKFHHPLGREKENRLSPYFQNLVANR